ncbi:hypothetical protein THS27_01970 [Thalassospira sp. MCCC 1A01428]|nr:hypothetical protein THS27_01970 [Thalassospira sp. MCCC 1A01428]
MLRFVHIAAFFNRLHVMPRTGDTPWPCDKFRKISNIIDLVQLPCLLAVTTSWQIFWLKWQLNKMLRLYRPDKTTK